MILQKLRVMMLMSLLILTSCSTVQPVDPRITIVDTSLIYDISISTVLSTINNSGFMVIQVNGVNKSSFYKKLEYKIEWLDQNGFLIQTILSRWTTFSTFENAKFKFKAVAPKSTATDFRILIRKGI